MDVSVLPSLTRPNWKEQFGRTLAEAMSCETPVIGSDSGEIPHVIGDAGLIFKEGDAQALAGAYSACSTTRRSTPTWREGAASACWSTTRKNTSPERRMTYITG